MGFDGGRVGSFRDLRVGLVYDRVNKWGGAERVLLALHEIFPRAPLYSAVYDCERASWAKVFPKVVTSFLQKLPGAATRHEWLVPLMPLAFESFDFSGFDVVISVTSEAAKGILTGPDTLHVCYCLTPPRYLWSQGWEHRQFHRYGVFSPVTKWLSNSVNFVLRQWDFQAARRPDVMVAISKDVVRRIRKYYQREVEVIYPPVDVKKFKVQRAKRKTKGEYFLVVSRLVPYKRVDLAVKVFNRLKKPLVIVGRGVEEERLKGMAGEKIKFVGDLTDEELASYYGGARALVCAQEEDFGMAAVEAMAVGVPVVALAKGGFLETVVEGETGVFFEEQSEEALAKAILKFDKMGWDEGKLIERAKKFDKVKFKKEFLEMVEKVWEERKRK